MPETELGVLSDALAGLDAIELGCGTAYVSARLARRGGRRAGIDLSSEQLRSARAFQLDFGLEFPLWHGNAEAVPAADESFDLAISEYGASIWCDPYRWIPEAARLLRPGGELIFLVNGVIAVLTFPNDPDDPDAPAGDRLLRLLRRASLRVGASVAVRGDLEGPQAGLTPGLRARHVVCDRKTGMRSTFCSSQAP